MKKIVVQVAWSDNYYGGWGDPDHGAIFCTGKDLETFKKEFKEALQFHIEGLVEAGTAPDWMVEEDYEVEYTLHIPAVL